MAYTLMLLAVLVGAVVPVQVGINATLQFHFGPGLFAALANMVVGGTALFIYLLVSRAVFPPLAALSHIPVWAWLGGVLGVTYVAGALTLGPKLGAALLIALTVAGQMFAALVLDHYGVLGYHEHTINVWRIVGALLLIAGVVLIQKN